jgi:hypothetical protein
MHCKLCNTRLSGGVRTCPNCGADAGPGSSKSEASRTTQLPSASSSTALDVDIELDDMTDEIAPPARSASSKTASKPSTAKARPSSASPSGAAPLFAPDAAGLRALLAENPEALEEGLGVYRNDDGKAVGAEYSTGVGDIDLLATSSDGDLVVVLISEKGQGEELVAEVLQRIGWVRKHLGDGEMKVRGVVLCEEAPEGLSYAAAAVADTVAFKTYRVALTFDDLEI